MVNPGSGASGGLTYGFLKILLSAAFAKMFAAKWALIRIGQSSHKIHLCMQRKQYLMLYSMGLQLNMLHLTIYLLFIIYCYCITSCIQIFSSFPFITMNNINVAVP